MTATLRNRVTGASSLDDFQTPPAALDILLPYLTKFDMIWECACGNGNLVNALRANDYKVIGTDKEYDFITSPPPADVKCIVTNPPYSLKNEFVARCFVLGLPFALLMPLSALEGKERQVFYRQSGLQLIIPDKRFHFACPEKVQGRESNSWFATAWFCHGLSLPRDLLFVETKAGRIA
jgi:hypothetical protein